MTSNAVHPCPILSSDACHGQADDSSPASQQPARARMTRTKDVLTSSKSIARDCGVGGNFAGKVTTSETKSNHHESPFQRKPSRYRIQLYVELLWIHGRFKLGQPHAYPGASRPTNLGFNGPVAEAVNHPSPHTIQLAVSASESESRLGGKRAGRIRVCKSLNQMPLPGMQCPIFGLQILTANLKIRDKLTYHSSTPFIADSKQGKGRTRGPGKSSE